MVTSTQRIERGVDDIENLAAAAPKERMALLLAGGDGTRLQELTAVLTGSPVPKQYCPLLRGRSLLELTLFRTRYFAPPERTGVVINQNHVQWAADQLHMLPDDQVFIQPHNRDTGPGMIFALQRMARVQDDAIVAIFPTDHFVDDDRAFIAHALRAACLVERYPDKIAILGIKPTRLETGYGYIVPGQPIQATPTPCRVYQVRSFCEKPNLAVAQELMSQGGLWNTFVMVFRLKRMLKLLRALAPEGSLKLFGLREDSKGADEAYRQVDAWNFSSRILARIPGELMVLEARDVFWSDWGTRESIERACRHMHLAFSWRPQTRNAARGAA